MNAIKQKFLQKTVDGRPYVSFQQWRSTLSEQDLAEYRQAELRQFAHRAQAIACGDMYIDPIDGNYVWKDEETARRGKPNDPVWFDFFERWRRECGIDDTSALEKESGS